MHAGVLNVLTAALLDDSDRVKRRVMATLGELLFFIVSQQQVRLRITQRAVCHLACKILNPKY